MNGRKARALRKQAAETAKTMDADYKLGKPIMIHGKYYEQYESPKRLVSTCHRAVYQQLKQT